MELFEKVFKYIDERERDNEECQKSYYKRYKWLEEKVGDKKNFTLLR